MRIGIRGPCLILLALLAGIFPVFSQSKKVLIIASSAPERSEWGVALNKMARDWKSATNGEIELNIFHNGTGGGEDEVLRKMRYNQVQGAVFTSFGLNSINPQVLTLSCPFMIRNNEELDAVLAELRPELEKKIEEAGFVSVAWSKAGWIRVFSRKPVFVPADLKAQKVGTNQSEAHLTKAFETLGYNMVPLNLTHIPQALSMGRVDAVYQSPLAALGFRYFEKANNMASINIAPFLGGIVLTRQAWASIPEKYRAELLRINREMERNMDISIANMENKAINDMAARGLIINQVSPEQERLWYTDMERSISALLGNTFDRDIFNRIDKILKAHRAEH